MSQNLISATLSDADAKVIQQNLVEVRNSLSFLLSLQPEDITGMITVGNSYYPFIEKAYQVFLTHPEILSGVFDKVEYEKDYNLFQAIKPILNQLNELSDSLQKTFYAAGSDTMVASLDIYSAVKSNKDKVPGLNVVADEMAVFFKKTKTKITTTKE